MKKLIYAFSALVVVLTTSCSNDSDSPAADGTLLKKLILTDLDGTLTSTFTYNGNKLVSIADDDGYVENYTYTGNLITSTQELENGSVISTNTFEYNSNGDLVTFKRFDETGEEFHTEGFVYNADGTITVNNYAMDILDNNDNPYIYEKEKLFLVNGELVKVESENFVLDNGVPTSTGDISTKNYTYDDKNNPFKNVLGFENQYYFEGDLLFGGRYRNLLTKTRVGSPDAETSTYTYNASGYPTTHTYTDESGEVETGEYIYE